MKKLKISIILLIFILSFCLIPTINSVYADELDTEEFNISELNDSTLEASAPISAEPKINSRAAIVYERNTNTILYEKNSNDIRPMASTTKIMTAIVALQNANLNDVVTVSKKAAWTGGSTVGLNTGDKITIHDLLYALMLKSGNDSAVTIAETIGGSIEGFADMMNKKAAELGLCCTHFVTPHGLDSNEHYTSAKDLALLTNYALSIPKFRDIVKTASYTLTINGKSNKVIGNTNELLGYLNGVYGVKTGFTNGAGRCLVTSTKRDNMDIICVVLGADTKKLRSQDSIKLIEYAFNNYTIVDLDNKFNDTFLKLKLNNKISVFKGLSDITEVYLQDLPSMVCVKKNEVDNLTLSVNYASSLEAPVEKDYIIGSITANIEDNILISRNILTSHYIARKNILDYLSYFLKNYIQYSNRLANIN